MSHPRQVAQGCACLEGSHNSQFLPQEGWQGFLLAYSAQDRLGDRGWLPTWQRAQWVGDCKGAALMEDGGEGLMEALDWLKSWI